MSNYCSINFTSYHDNDGAVIATTLYDELEMVRDSDII